eukprot:TRINITY_DN18727_c0_g1_i8.p1 TRINITY_DN18727_c0_g1~~TRINITY_DN18727_c0_g1_i8.p1  ORF type:complete len:159 (-),score=14.32 TRINITY_DN18727_c0_g1_i8:158-634(-)
MPEYNVHYAKHAEDPMNLPDAPLTLKGQMQARQAAKEVVERRLSVDLAITSPLTRAMQTCMMVLPPTPQIGQLRYEICADLAEHMEASCDIGREPAKLLADFPELTFEDLADVWWWFPDEARGLLEGCERTHLISTESRKANSEPTFRHGMSPFRVER